MNIGDIIKEKREAAKISQEELAKLVGVTQTDVSRWESNIHQPSLKNLMYLCEKLEIDLSEYMKGR